MSTSDKVAVIKARLPYIDRRALSEAWYSALHVAADGKVRVPARRAGDFHDVLPAGVAPRAGAPANSIAANVPRSWSGPERRAPQSAPPNGKILPQAATRAAKAAAFQRARSYPPFNATLTLGIDGARVAVLLRRDGPALRVIALCSARHVEVVRRALACADRHLRARGELVLSDVRVAGVETRQ